MKEAGRGDGAKGRELKPMVGPREEVAALAPEFHLYFLSFSVFPGCPSSGKAFVICFSADLTVIAGKKILVNQERNANGTAVVIVLSSLEEGQHTNVKIVNKLA